LVSKDQTLIDTYQEQQKRLQALQKQIEQINNAPGLKTLRRLLQKKEAEAEDQTEGLYAEILAIQKEGKKKCPHLRIDYDRETGIDYETGGWNVVQSIKHEFVCRDCRLLLYWEYWKEGNDE
jgi:hypothetical protein